MKLVFLADKPSEKGFTSERMWVEVTEIAPSGYVGVLDNDPSFLDLSPGTEVKFAPQHVIALYASPSGLSIPCGQSAFAARGIVEAGEWPVEAVRVVPQSGDSSGWIIRAKAGLDGDLVSVLVDDLVQQFRILDSVLDEPVGTRWLWDPGRLEYVAMPALS